jgi:hypothetical protein
MSGLSRSTMCASEEPRRVGLLENAGVGLRVRAEAMQHHPERTMIFVLQDIEEPRGVARPDDVPGGVLDVVVEVGFGGDVAHADRVHF